MLVARNIEVFRGSKAILRDLSMSLCPGELVALLGPSGAGKSTLLKSMTGLITPDTGSVSLDDKLLGEWPAIKLARQLALVPQDDILHTNLTVNQALEYGAQLRLASDTTTAQLKERIDTVLTQIELKEHSRKVIRQLSGGQRKRVNVAMELLSSPKFLFLDEPTSGLDPALEEQMTRLFRDLANKGQGILTSTHAMGSLELVDAIALVFDGMLISFAPLQQTLQYFKVPHIAEVFKVLRKQSAEAWRTQFKSTAMAKSCFAKRRADTRKPQAAIAQMKDLIAQSQANSQNRAQPKTDSPVSPKPSAATPVKAQSGNVDDLLAELAKELEQEKNG